ncbi:MAG: bifunctional phosphoribosyl-AMP cyclohydrolase/phosphoribosyl-ATP diphosphatase HisIE [Alphaproteobacteria bacterium CG_4_10_14_0_2_um_filter_63_37]|nr:MAG: bifunctional phosphoribosyl-AMP cyclohydrolase/phosphoribosyl-ATP pyrophosphatase [Proteobacteria bacterium CG1_02_64_396]PJA23985.1 MAG: bifunctional phosphoribosyl-AMP cyclohydrolase/phosphoribosyl-ATP diphosphatase HisIE [Alphaproteobacteria bacterium CG_4_10_14_0_2_um_filter_63_37]
MNLPEPNDVLIESLAWPESGLLPAIAQDAATGRVLMLAWVDREAVRETLGTGFAWYFSRSRGKLWQKGESSGHTQRIIELRTDCDKDTLLYVVEQVGPACHTGRVDCFFEAPTAQGWQAVEPLPTTPLAPLAQLQGTIHERRGADPETSWTATLFAQGREKILQKVGEEAVEFVLASSLGTPEKAVSEAADLMYHLMVALSEQGQSLDDVAAELARREGVSGLTEKASRPKG